MMLISKIARIFRYLNEFGGNQVVSPGWKHTQPSARLSLLNFWSDWHAKGRWVWAGRRNEGNWLMLGNSLHVSISSRQLAQIRFFTFYMYRCHFHPLLLTCWYCSSSDWEKLKNSLTSCRCIVSYCRFGVVFMSKDCKIQIRFSAISLNDDDGCFMHKSRHSWSNAQ